MKNTFMFLSLLPSVVLFSSCSKHSPPKFKTHTDIVQAALEAPLCETTFLSFENGGSCQIRLKHVFKKITENSYEVNVSALDDCSDMSLETLLHGDGIRAILTTSNLNKDFFGEMAIYYMEFSENKRKATVIHSSSSDISKVDILRNYSELTSFKLAEENSSEEPSLLSKKLCTQTNRQTESFCSKEHLAYLGTKTANDYRDAKGSIKLSIYKMLFKDNFCGTKDRHQLYETFLVNGDYSN